MTYNLYDGVKKKKQYRAITFFVASLLIVVGGYMLYSVVAPSLPSSIAEESERVTKVLTEQKPDLKQDRLYVPKIGVDVAIVTGVSEKTLEGGAWHRVPENGDPVTGGNFVLAAHRFNLGLTPSQTRAKSPFFNLNTLQSGDQVFVDYKGTRYAYEVTKRYKVGGTDTSIESQIDGTRMTLYSCDLRGPKAGREVVEAKPVGTIAWTDGSPKIKTIQ